MVKPPPLGLARRRSAGREFYESVGGPMSDWDGETTAHAAEGPQWVSAAEAADAAGVTPGTVRYWARNGLIVSEAVQGPAGERTLVRLDEVMRHAREGAPHGSPAGGGLQGRPGGGQVVTELPARTSELAPILKSIPEIMAQLTAATDRAARAETKGEFLSAQLTALRRRLAEAEAGRPAAAGATVVPEAWEAAAQEARPEAGGGGPTGWPAPPAEPDYGAATSDAPGTEPAWGISARDSRAPAWSPGSEDPGEPGPDSIDWGTGESDDPPQEQIVASPSPESSGNDSSGVSLQEIWGRAATTEPPPPAPAAEPAPAPAPGGSEEVHWHEPTWGATETQPEPEPPPPPPRRANATVPGDEFYGPRRRRWFKRRK